MGFGETLGLNAIIGVDTKQFHKGLQGIKSGIKQTVTAVTQIATAVTAAGAGLIALSERQERAERRLEFVIKSTGGAAELSAKQMKEHAAALQEMTGYSDDAIISAQALLASFVEIKGPVFKDATKMILNMSSLFDQDLKSSAVQLGKALNDPIKGITALSRVGVSFSEDEKKVITALAETGQVAKAQEKILKSMADQGLRNAASAAAGTFSGKLEILTGRLGDMGEEVGKALSEGLTPFANELLGLNLNQKSREMKTLTETVKLLGEAFGAVASKALTAFKRSQDFFKSLIPDELPEGPAFTKGQRSGRTSLQNIQSPTQSAVDEFNKATGIGEGQSQVQTTKTIVEVVKEAFSAENFWTTSAYNPNATKELIEAVRENTNAQHRAGRATQ